MQRLTETGIHHLDELDLLLPKPEAYELTVSYRQSARLLKMASELYCHSMRQQATFKSAFDGDGADDPPLVTHTPTDEVLTDWLVQRILEVHRAWGNRLRPIAVLVPSDDRVDAVERRVRPLLEERSIDTTACFRSEALGTEARVRIFDIRYIKGLEFEAVFYPYIDVIARQEPQLVDKYLYVGLTRARSFLGVTYEREFPQQLACAKAHFQTGDWQGLAAAT